ncbi:MAG: hypothetical protein VCA34_14195 [Roseibacillus sp.]
MRHLTLSLLLGTVLSLNVGCQKNTEDPASPKTQNENQAAEASPAPPAEPAPAAEHPAITAANKVLAAIHAGDAAAIRPLLNATNQKKVSDEELPEFLKEAKEEIGDVTKVTEVRKGRRENQVAAKIRVVENEVFVVTLTLEDGQYLFEDLNSPDVAGYEALEKIAP